MGYNALDKEAFVTLEKSRFNVPTIDSELIPELLSWSALMNALPQSCTQTIPSDITKPDGTDTIHETIREATLDEANSLLSSILDPTTIEAGFDQSCFDALDELLIHDPFEAFFETCWQDAVGHNKSMRVSTPTQLLTKPTGRRKLPPLPVTSQITEERVEDISQFLTYYREEEPAFSPVDRIEANASAPPRPEQDAPWSKRYTSYSTISDEDEATSFILFEAPARAPNRYDLVGHFPMSSTRPQKNGVSSHIPTFCTNLPAPFTSLR